MWRPGQQLQRGRYTIERILGVGGFGVTYLASKRNARRDEEWVVIKTLKDEIRHRPDLANRQIDLQEDFLNEALKLAQCHHPHVVQVKELIREAVADGVIDGIIMEYIQGESLANRLSRQGILPEAEALRYIRQVGVALTAVHEQRLLHRDIKPQNIMIRSGTSEAVLIDFGLAREFMQDLIQTHSLALTHGFAPPEQYDRRAIRGAYTDVYALAATLYCSLTQHTPLAAFLRLSGTALESPKQLNPGISDRVNQAILKGLELKADDRPQSMQEWLSLLEEPINRPVAPVRKLPGQSESPNSTPQKPSSAEQNRRPIPKPAVPLDLERILRESVILRPLSTAHNRTSATRRRSNTIPWIRLAFVLAGYATAGVSFTVSSAPLWAGVGAGVVITVVPGAVVVAGAVARAVVGGTVTGAGAVAGETLLEFLNRLHTFLILAGTSLAGLSLGWLIGTMLLP